MNEETTRNQFEEDERQSTAGPAGCESSESAGGEAEENFGARAGEHFREGAADAAKAVNAFMPKLRTFTEKSIYKGVYGLSFGANFSGKLVKDVVFDNVTKGAREGARAGRDAAAQFRKRRQSNAAETVVDVTEIDPSSAPA